MAYLAGPNLLRWRPAPVLCSATVNANPTLTSSTMKWANQRQFHRLWFPHAQVTLQQ